MTEQEWMACTDPTPMLDFLRGKASDRKLRLLGVACCRRIWRRLKDGRCRKVVGVAERFADGLATQEELAAAWELAVIFTQDVKRDEDTGPTAAAFFVTSTSLEDLMRVPRAASRSLRATEPIAQGVLIRCIFGNPFRPVTLDHSCRTPTVTALATAIYDDRLFDDLPILADALEEDGCTDADILAHCRQPNEHVRGCWVLDLLLDKQ